MGTGRLGAAGFGATGTRCALTEVIDQDEWSEAQAKEENGKRLLTLASENWHELSEHIEDRYGE